MNQIGLSIRVIEEALYLAKNAPSSKGWLTIKILENYDEALLKPLTRYVYLFRFSYNEELKDWILNSVEQSDSTNWDLFKGKLNYIDEEYQTR